LKFALKILGALTIQNATLTLAAMVRICPILRKPFKEGRKILVKKLKKNSNPNNIRNASVKLA
jgi:hypothetical protein